MPPPLLIERLHAWLKRAVHEAQAADGPRYMPGRRGFVPLGAHAAGGAAGGGHAMRPSALDAQQFAALSQIIGRAGCARLNELLLDMVASHAAALRRVLDLAR